MQAIPITYQGINFRSKLEARWYIFMKNLGWNVEYEPHIEKCYDCGEILQQFKSSI